MHKKIHTLKPWKCVNRKVYNSFQELKTQLTKLEQDHKNWRKKSQQMALSVNEDKMSKSEKDKYYKGVADRRKEQNKLLTDVVVYRMECTSFVF